MTVEKLAEEMEGAGKAKTIWSLLRVGENPLEGSSPQTLEEEKLVTSGRVLSDRSKAKLISVLDVNRLIPASISSETVSDCGTRKLLLRLEDGQSIESVLIPQDYATTLCVSTQIGCDRGCAFCATGTMGLIRNLTASEIIAQVVIAKRVAIQHDMPEVNNVVYMGMGDAGRNIEAVNTSVHCLVDRQRLSMPQSKVTVSTVGPSPEAFLQLSDVPATLAWSLHSPDNRIRKLLVPSTRHTTEELREGFLQALLMRQRTRQRTIMIAFTLIDGINDSLDDAQRIAEFVAPMLAVAPKIVLNLIPYNDNGLLLNGQPLKRPQMERVIQFQQHLRDKGYFCSIRTTRGDDDSAACGMLATKRLRREAKQNYE
eukprot:CAMPEP_0174959316 /NCGR_PEP_ID=MMETSP0004_2-20121128/3111_1 /TAXON_ID=420556 /ORGANISM="Ochromonas sp., Strain CCMP1393" /LENGTH=369 /DNA_ID=CAMNT_0016207625 /DNA_START=192 /DNA_END=1301 /DNA_ORIENTATION=-